MPEATRVLNITTVFGDDEPVVAVPSHWQRFRRNPGPFAALVVIIVLVLMALLAPFIAPYDPIAESPDVFQGPSLAHLLGTDSLGRDLLSRTIFGAQISLLVGVLSVALGGALGVMSGVVAGFYGGWIDDVVMRTIDVLLAVPVIILALTVLAALGPSLPALIVAIGISTWPGMARLARAQTLTEKERDYVIAARAIGAGTLRILWQHVFPNIVGVLVVMATTGLGGAILTASGLSFLGLGVPPPTPTWGGMVSDGRQFLFTAPHVAIVPGAFIMLTVLAFNLAGDGLRDVLDPRAKVRRGPVR